MAPLEYCDCTALQSELEGSVTMNDARLRPFTIPGEQIKPATLQTFQMLRRASEKQHLSSDRKKSLRLLRASSTALRRPTCAPGLIMDLPHGKAWLISANQRSR